MALGSGRARLARHVLVESALLALMGGIAGVLLAYAGDARAGRRSAPAGIPRLDEIGVNGAALAFTAVVSVLAGVLFGVLPALASSSARTMGALRDGGRSATLGRDRHRTRNALVMTQVALAFVLVIGSGLMVRSFEALRSVDPGFSADGVLTFTVRPLATKYGDAEAVAQFYDRLIERLEAVPGVTRAGAINALPLTRQLCNELGGGDRGVPSGRGRVSARLRGPPHDARVLRSDEHPGRRGTRVHAGRPQSSSRLRRSSAAPSRTGTGPIRVRWASGSPSRASRRKSSASSETCTHTRLDVPAEQFVYLPMLDAEGSNPGGAVISDDDDRSYGRRAAEPRERDPQRDRGARPRSADGGRPADAARARRFDEPHELHGVRAHDRGARRAVLGIGRHLRRAVVRREPAHGRDRNPHGARRDARESCAAWSSRRGCGSRASAC